MNKQLSLFDPVEIPLTQGQVALVDRVDADLTACKWYVLNRRGTPYACRHVPHDNARVEHLQRIVLERILGRSLMAREQVNHIDGDSLNNRRGNLRVATNTQNQQHARRHKNNRSGYKGVAWHKKCRKWQAYIRANGRTHHLGLFKSPEAAYAAYCAAAEQYFGEFARYE